ncbi:hypothetical protein M885DRAFT_618688 [Pelagophyceae sp. CCMP2097]|nr:hypothetical protein M885DRAFT_618688 [Pelagophyceae sp. CCMP2097]
MRPAAPRRAGLLCLAVALAAGARAPGALERGDGDAQQGLFAAPPGLVARGLRAGPAQFAHDAVLRADSDAAAKGACELRLETLRNLVRNKNFADAVELSFALGANSPHRAPAACRADAPVVSRADVLVTVATSITATGALREDSEAAVTLHGQGGALRLRGGLKAPTSMLGASVVGFILDGEFISSEATIRCEEHSQGFDCASGDGRKAFPDLERALEHNEALSYGRERARKFHKGRLEDYVFGEETSPDYVFGGDNLGEETTWAYALGTPRLGDKSTDYALGIKSIIVYITCPTAFHADCDKGYDDATDGFLSRSYGGTVEEYLRTTYVNVDNFYKLGSYGAFELKPTYVYVNIDYSLDDCKTLKFIGDLKATSVNVLAMDYAQRTFGLNSADFDFRQIIIPKCETGGWAGRGMLGFAENVVMVGGWTADEFGALVIVHEFGHNLGLLHASFDQETKGSVAYFETPFASDEEYASPFSAMGNNGFLPSEAVLGYPSAQYLVESKLNLDWLVDSDVALVEPYSDDNLALCGPCGPFLLQAADAPVADRKVLLGLSIASMIPKRRLYLEYRAAHGGVLMTWADQEELQANSGGTGLLSNTCLVDATPETTSLKDAVLKPGGSFLLDLSASAAEAGERYLTVDVGSVDAQGRLSVSVTATSTSAPTSTFAPSPPPFPAPSSSPTSTPAPSFAFANCRFLQLSGGNSDALTFKITYVQKKAPPGCAGRSYYEGEQFGRLVYIYFDFGAWIVGLSGCGANYNALAYNADQALRPEDIVQDWFDIPPGEGDWTPNPNLKADCLRPTGNPTAIPSTKPSNLPTNLPTNKPTALPTTKPSAFPTSIPTNKPSAIPTTNPRNSC